MARLCRRASVCAVDAARRWATLSGPKPTGHYHEPDLATREHKKHFGASREARGFGG